MEGISRVASAGFLLLLIVVAAGAWYAFFAYPGTDASSSASTSASTSQSTPVTSASSLSSASPLITFNADAYTTEVQTLLTGFTRATAIPTAPTHSAGSFALAKQIASGSQVDVFIPVALSATAPSNLGSFSANWAVGFASDQMVLAYSNATLGDTAGSSIASQFQRALKTNLTSDWNSAFTALTSGQVKVGISDPNADPAGLRGWLVLEAAGFYYGGNGQSTYSAPLLASKANVTGSAAANMVAPLQAGQFQFLFIYRSAAIAQHLGYLQLDHVVNFGSPKWPGYDSFSYTLSTGTTKGAPIILCMTIPTDAPHASEAAEFVQYVVANAGPVVSQFGLQPMSPPLLYENAAPPQFLADMASRGQLANGGALGP